MTIEAQQSESTTESTAVESADNADNAENKIEVSTAPATTAETELITLQGTLRTQLGKSGARQLRRQGLVPANVLDGGQSKLVSLSPKWLEKIWRTGGVFQLELLDEASVYTVKMHEVQLHPVKRMPIHLDLMVVR